MDRVQFPAPYNLPSITALEDPKQCQVRDSTNKNMQKHKYTNTKVQVLGKKRRYLHRPHTYLIDNKVLQPNVFT